MEQILELQTTTKITYDMHINSEFERLRAQSQQQLEIIKQHHQEILERETRVLREAKDDACRELTEVRKQLREVSWDTKVLELSNLYRGDINAVAVAFRSILVDKN